MKLGDVLRKWRPASDLGIREAAAQMAISHATLSRIERGENLDGARLAKLIIWLFSK